MPISDRDKAKIAQLLEPFSTDPHLRDFVFDHLGVARQVVRKFSDITDGASFNEWKQMAMTEFGRLVTRGETEWQSLVLHLAYEELKATQGNWFRKIFAKVWGLLTRNGLDGFARRWVGDIATAILPRLKEAATNGDVQAALRDAWTMAKGITKTDKGTWIQIGIDLAIAVLRKRGMLPPIFGG